MAENTEPGQPSATPGPTSNPPPGGPQSGSITRLKDWVITNAPLLAAVVTAIMFVLIIASLFWPFLKFSEVPQTTLLRELSNTHVARGLITFLVAVSTVGIALILTVYAVATRDANAKDNFGMAKEVLSSLIGVLGTIVGFYFGSTITPSTQPESAPTAQVGTMTLGNVAIDPEVAKVGDKFKITAQISGSKPPYGYELSFKPESSLNRSAKTDGKISEDFTVPATMSPGTTLEATLKVKDLTGKFPDVVKPLRLTIRQ